MKQLVNAFTCDAHGCDINYKPTYTLQEKPDGWVSFEFDGRRVWACPTHACPLIDLYGVRE